MKTSRSALFLALTASMLLSGCDNSASVTDGQATAGSDQKTLQKDSAVDDIAEADAPHDAEPEASDDKSDYTPPGVSLSTITGYNPDSRVVMAVTDRDYTLFSLTPVSETDDQFALLAAPASSDYTVSENDSLMFIADGTSNSFSPVEPGTLFFMVDKTFLASLEDAQEVTIELSINGSAYYDGDYFLGKTKTFRESISGLMVE